LSEGGSEVAVDGSGNIYTTGGFRGQADFDPGPGTYNLTSTNDPTGSPSRDAFVSKLIPVSPLLAFGGTARGQAHAAALTLGQIQPLLTEAIARWAAAGVDTSALGNVQVIITNLPGAELGAAAGHTGW